MKKRISAIALALVLALSLTPADLSVAAAESFTPVTGWDMMAQLGAGITFANTTEARAWPWDENPNPEDTEVVWGQPKIEQWQLESVALKGFDSYRICVSWTPHMDANYKIDPAWMDRIQEITDWALDAGLNVVINTHHEEELYQMIRDGKYDEAKKHLTALWAQVAERFKNYSEKVVFEVINEPNLLERYGGDGEWITVNGQISRTLCDMVNKLNKDALDTIRKSGGNNDKRVVMLCLPGAHALTIPYMEIPNDPYILYGAFGYDGFFFNTKEIMPIIQKLLDQGVGFINKEDNEAADPKAHFETLAKMGIPSFYFTGSASNADDKTGLLNRITGAWANIPILKAFLAAYGKTPGPDLAAPPAKLPYELKGPYHDKDYDYWNPSQKERAAAEKMVIELTADISWYKVALSGPSPFTEYEIGHERFSTEAGKIIFDLRGLEGNRIGFLTWNDGDAAKIKRIYLDTWAGSQTTVSETPNLSTAAGWAQESVGAAYALGLIPASLQNHYSQTITRAEYCALTVTLYEKLTGAAITERKSFPDDGGDVNIQKLYGLGIVSGSGGTFDPKGEFSRAHVAAMTVNILKALGKPLPAASSTFADNAKIPSWALPAVGQVQAAGLMNGVGNNQFGADVKYNRQSAIIQCKLLYDKYK